MKIHFFDHFNGWVPKDNTKRIREWINLLECLKKYPNYLGYELFSYANESWKGNHLSENNYGILTEDGKEKSTYYAIKDFKNTDAFKLNIKNILYLIIY